MANTISELTNIYTQKSKYIPEFNRIGRLFLLAHVDGTEYNSGSI